MTDTRAQTIRQSDVLLNDGIEMSEPGNAERLAIQAKGRIHYVETLGVWYAYRDGRWEMDANGITLLEFSKDVPKLCFTMASLCKPSTEVLRMKEKDRSEDEQDDVEKYELHMSWARKSNTEPTLKRLITLARGLPGIRISHEELDAQPWLFNVQNGTFDFMTGQFRGHDSGDLLTKMANVWYDPDATAPVWQGYLDEWQPDHAKQQFLQDITGSGMTGIPVQNLFVNTGTGRNGKGTFYKTVQNILGDYAGTASEDMLIETRYRVHDEEKARLRGCRSLLAPETAAGDRLDEAGIKNMTGGDLIHARHLYGRPFDFKPSHTAFLHTNHDPQIRGTDPAIWARVIKITWNHLIEASKRDMLIDDKLEKEKSGILNWLLAGCQRFIRHGVKPPKSVMDDTEQYRADQDTIHRFTADTIDAMVLDASQLGGVDFVPASIVRKHYELWCLAEGIHPWSAQSVSKELRRLGWEQGQRRMGKAVVKIWTPPATRSSDTSDTSATLAPPLTSPLSICTPVSLNHHINPIGGERESRNPKGINRDFTDTDTHPTDEEIEADHREWLRTHGYSVPPMATDEEIELWGLNQRDAYAPPEPTAHEIMKWNLDNYHEEYHD